MRVVLVDDAADFRTLVRITVGRADGFTVVAEAGDGIDGLAAVEAQQPDLVITDLQMPRMDGLAFSAAVREAHPDLPIVMITGFPVPEIMDEALGAGVSAFLEKRGGMSELVPTLRAVLEPDAPAIVRVQA